MIDGPFCMPLLVKMARNAFRAVFYLGKTVPDTQHLCL